MDMVAAPATGTDAIDDVQAKTAACSCPTNKLLKPKIRMYACTKWHAITVIRSKGLPRTWHEITGLTRLRITYYPKSPLGRAVGTFERYTSALFRIPLSQLRVCYTPLLSTLLPSWQLDVLSL
jgi:hypothetical protein